MTDGRKSRSRNTGVDYIVYIVTIVALLLLLSSYLATYVNPNKNYWFAFSGLIAPGIYILNIILLLYWTLRWKAVALVIFVCLLIGIGNVSKFVRPNLSKYTDEQTATGTIRVLSYNVGGFLGGENGVAENITAQIIGVIKEKKPDIVCFQEYESNTVNRALLDSAFMDWKYKAASFILGDGNHYGWGLAIYSKYPILKHYNMNFPESNNSVMWADLIVRRDTVRVFNVHLQTTGINEDDRTFISPEALNDSPTYVREKGMSIARKLKRNFQIRANQADSISPVIHDGTSHVIVCGDFNDTPMSYTYRRIKGGFVDSFRRKGRGVVATYKGLYGIFRIDYIFHSADFETISYEVPVLEWSDHNPVIADLKIK